MSLVSAPVLDGLLAGVVGRPVTVDVLKHKPARRLTVRATGPVGTAIAKAYASERGPTVAARIRALADGPAEPVLPRVLHVDASARVLILSEVPGRPLADAVSTDQRSVLVCRRAGAALGEWHRAWYRRPPPALAPHTVERELDILRRRAAAAHPATAAAVQRLLPALGAPWPCPTAVHRDLYEAHIVIDGRVGLIDLDDAACGPPELDVGNLLAHVRLLALRLGAGLDPPVAALLDGYRSTGPELDANRLRQCERLSLLRLACIHSEPALLTLDASDGDGDDADAQAATISVPSGR